MKKNILNFIIVFVLFLACSTNKDKKVEFVECNQKNIGTYMKIHTIDSIDIKQLTNQRWLQVISPDCIPSCINILTFMQDGTYKDDNSEWGLVYDGLFKIIRDTIFLTQYDYASELPTNENRIVKKAIFAFIYMKDSLKLINNKQIEEGQIIATYYPENPVYYYKEK